MTPPLRDMIAHDTACKSQTLRKFRPARPGRRRQDGRAPCSTAGSRAGSTPKAHRRDRAAAGQGRSRRWRGAGSRSIRKAKPPPPRRSSSRSSRRPRPRRCRRSRLMSARRRWCSRSWPGARIGFLEKALPPGAAIVRAMPNTPAAIGRGITRRGRQRQGLRAPAQARERSARRHRRGRMGRATRR